MSLETIEDYLRNRKITRGLKGPRVTLSKGLVERLPVDDMPYVVWDDEVKAMRIKVSIARHLK